MIRVIIVTFYQLIRGLTRSSFLLSPGYRNRLARYLDFFPGDLGHSIKSNWTNATAGVTLGTLTLVNNMYHSLATRYRLSRTLPETYTATFTFVRKDEIGDQVGTG